MKLIIAEKPSLARTVAKVIGITNDNSRSSGHIVCKDNYVITWVFGHILELYEPQDYGEKYKSWSLDLLPIVPTTWKYQVKKDAKDQFNNIKTLLKSATTVINCGDPDREGQLLIDELLLHLNVKLPTKRLLILDPKDSAIKKALNEMEDNSKYRSWYQAGLLRSQADWLIGMNCTRAFTQLGSRSGVDGVVSVGRVQTPTLKLIYDRHLAIQNYKPLNFYNLMAEFATNTGESFTAKLDLKSTGLPLDIEGRLLNDSELKIISEKINGKLGFISEYEVKAGETSPPSLFKLSDLQAVANAKLGLSADETLKIAQSLYEKQLITYPRTACACLPESLHADAAKIVPMLIPDLILAVQIDASIVDLSIKSKAFDDKKLDGESHFAIIPTGVAPYYEALTQIEISIFNLIGLQYIIQFMPNLKFEQTTGTVDCENYKFNFSGKVIKSLGWKEAVVKNNLLNKHKTDEDNEDNDDKEEQKLPTLVLNQDVKNIFNNNIQKSTTTKPKPYTEGTLIKAMANIHNLLDEIVKSYYNNKTEAKQAADTYKKILKDTAGLGTEATRAGIIKTLKTRQFITNKGKNLEITDKGLQFMGLIASGKNLIEFSQLTSPLTTAMYEQELDNVLNHKRQANDFYNEIVNNLLHPKLELIRQILNEMPLPANKQSRVITGEKCPKCNSDILERDGKFGKFKGCSNYPNCKYIVPRVKAPVAVIEQNCPQCGSAIVEKDGKFGKFLACSNNPNCKWTKVHAKPKSCPKCGKEMVKRKSKDGTKEFLGCSGFPDCKNIEWL
ncbi:MAG: DNA topoisomerase III [Neisseriaceae bacterium]|nr:MAG: DNA topoisomerase III [Neisseriaceae bacterium]